MQDVCVYWLKSNSRSRENIQTINRVFVSKDDLVYEFLLDFFKSFVLLLFHHHSYDYSLLRHDEWIHW